MPQMGESLAEGTVVRWLKAPGDQVARDEPLFEISTDKVDTDVPAPAAGVLSKILVQEGQTVAVGEPVALLETAETVVAAQTGAADRPAPPVDAPPRTDDRPREPAAHFASSHAPQLVSFRRTAAGPPAAQSPQRSFSPAVLDTARRSGVTLDALTTLQGSGRGGRITKGDVERFLRERGNAPAPVPAAAGTAKEADAPAEYLYRPAPGDRRVPMSPVRRKIAHHMSASVRISPHATAENEVDMSVAARQLEQARPQQAEAPITYTALMALAAVRALRDFPVLNSSVVGDDVIYKPQINLGIAVALPDSDDLIVPVIRQADELSAVGMARAIADLASRARRRELRPDDVQGGTFTLTNPGIFGGLRGTPILNQPQVAILGLGAIIRRPVVIKEAIAIRPIMNVSLTFDHRATDGMVAFRYLARVRQLLEEDGNEGAATANGQ
ncbi:MAG TPA: dihydrolipoamide acetyltransferase family protein [Vicinamibacterales bacterium]|nr:dihydrolipoamide acetyltransferase family protein [Vicinamibacterales bacterium]